MRIKQEISNAIDFLHILYSSKFFNKKYFPIVDDNLCLKILGNGKSLTDVSLDENANVDYLVVNRHVLADNYSIIKPKYYVLADPHFFSHPEGLSILQKIYSITKWKMTIFIPYGAEKSLKNYSNNLIDVVFYNTTSYAENAPFSAYFYSHQLAMPCVQNVIVAAIMIGILKKYQRIELYGVEHDWLKNLYVGEDNLVYLLNSHFYDKNVQKPKPQKDIQHLDEYPLYRNIMDYARMFESYWEIKQYLKHTHSNIKVINKTKNSYIDAFER